MPDLRHPSAPAAPSMDDLDAQCRGIGTPVAWSAAAAARAARRDGPPAGAGVRADVPITWPVVRGGDGAAARPAARAP